MFDGEKMQTYYYISPISETPFKYHLSKAYKYRSGTQFEDIVAILFSIERP